MLQSELSELFACVPLNRETVGPTFTHPGPFQFILLKHRVRIEQHLPAAPPAGVQRPEVAGRLGEVEGWVCRGPRPGLFPSLPRISYQTAWETSSQTHYFRKFLFRGSRLPLLDCKLPQGGNHGYHFLASLRKPSWALELSRCADWGSE